MDNCSTKVRQNTQLINKYHFLNCNTYVFIFLLGNFNETGSSPPRDKHSKTPDTIFVLDIAGTAPQPFTYCALALKKPDPRRRSTQTWRFTDDGRLCCVHKNMCVQSKDGFMGLYEGWDTSIFCTHSNA